MKRYLKIFEADSNLEDVRWRSFILNSEDLMLEIKDEWEDQNTSISLIVEGMGDETFSWDEGCKVEKLLLGKNESNEEEWLSECEDWSFLALE